MDAGISTGGAVAAPRLQPIGPGEWLDLTFRVFRKAWKPLMGIGAVAAVPSLLQALFSPLGLAALSDPRQNPFLKTTGGEPQFNLEALSQFGIEQILLMILSLLIVPLTAGAVARVAARYYGGEPMEFGDAIKAALRRYPVLFGATVVLMFINPFVLLAAAVAGLLILSIFTLIAGILLCMMVWHFALCAVVIDDAGAFKAVGRGFSLVRQLWWPILGRACLAAVVYFVISGVFGMAVGPLAVGTMLTQSKLAAYLLAVVQTLGNAVIVVLSFLGPALLYYDTRARVEGLDLEFQILQPPPRPE